MLVLHQTTQTRYCRNAKALYESQVVVKSYIILISSLLCLKFYSFLIIFCLGVYLVLLFQLSFFNLLFFIFYVIYTLQFNVHNKNSLTVRQFFYELGTIHSYATLFCACEQALFCLDNLHTTSLCILSLIKYLNRIS